MLLGKQLANTDKKLEKLDGGTMLPPGKDNGNMKIYHLPATEGAGVQPPFKQQDVGGASLLITCSRPIYIVLNEERGITNSSKKTRWVPSSILIHPLLVPALTILSVVLMWATFYTLCVRN